MAPYYKDKIPKSEQDVLEGFRQPYYGIEKGHVVRLILSNEKITSFPENLVDLKHLKILYLSFYELNHLSESICDLKYLKKLYLTRCELISIPECIGNLKKLKVLDLSNNRLKKLPDTLTNLIHLSELDLKSNNLISLPDNIGNLTLLRKLFLNNNQLTSLPESFEDLQKLRKFNLKNNCFTSVPKSLEKLKHLKEFNITKNPLKTLSYLSKKTFSLLSSYIHTDKLTPKGKRLFLEYHCCITPLDDSIDIDRKEILLDYYGKTTQTLALNYISDQNLLTEDEKERLIHEAREAEIKILENGLSVNDFVLKKIIERNFYGLSNGLKIYL